MIFLGYDPGGKNAHGVAAINVAANGSICAPPLCNIVENAEAAWNWLIAHGPATAVGMDTLLAWSPFGSRACDNALRRYYGRHGASVIAQNSLYSAMTLNGAIIAKRFERTGIPQFETHPKLFLRAWAGTHAATDPATQSILKAYENLRLSEGTDLPRTALTDHSADAVIAAWCAAQAYLGHWTVDLYAIPGDKLEPVVRNARFPWPERITAP
ncbi:DUF429 domain-containing protein [Ketogulonicigenium vulgare]|uniref:DUF429 domain-containing protein n=1 Tax=Ketogulonicigenium vulgare TaxID=92945 RepID=UPI002358D581|nr:DUF429 domain-containing protein [Ketogulonicigenium vulgare]